MATLTAQQRTDLQNDLGITNNQLVFTDAELDRNYTRQNSDYDKTLLLCWRQLYAQAVRLFKYTTGNTSEERQQIKSNIREQIDYLENRLGDAGGILRSGALVLMTDQRDENA